MKSLLLLATLLACSTVLPLAAQFSGHDSRPNATTNDWQPQHSYAKRALRLRVLSWNVENLFDTLHDEGFHDEQFLPSAERRWTSPRYWRKQGAIARTLVAAAELQPIDLIALCEIENDTVVDHLCRRTRMARLGYAYLVTHSADRRGVDVALLYQPTTLSLLSSASLRVPFDAVRERPTRDILHATFRASRGDTLDVFVAHLPSRLGGAAHSSPYRERAAGLIARAADSLSRIRRRPHLIALGDFNDEPSDASIARVLSPYFYALTPHATAYPSDSADVSSITGTYFFRHQWSRIDQILISRDFLELESVSTASKSASSTSKSPFTTRPSRDIHIFAPSFLLERSSSGELHPRRTFLGTYYHGGISDHLPLFADFWY